MYPWKSWATTLFLFGYLPRIFLRRRQSLAVKNNIVLLSCSNKIFFSWVSWWWPQLFALAPLSLESIKMSSAHRVLVWYFPLSKCAIKRVLQVSMSLFQSHSLPVKSRLCSPRCASHALQTSLLSASVPCLTLWTPRHQGTAACWVTSRTTAHPSLSSLVQRNTFGSLGLFDASEEWGRKFWHFAGRNPVRKGSNHDNWICS